MTKEMTKTQQELAIEKIEGPCVIKAKEKDTEKSSGQISGQISGQMLTGGQERVLKLIKENPRITRKELSDKLSINPSAVQKYIEKLKKLGRIKRIGPDKGGSWEVLG